MQLQEHQEEYYSLIETMLESTNIQIKYEAQKSYASLLRHLKDVAFNEKWHSIFNYAWEQIQNSKYYIERMGRINSRAAMFGGMPSEVNDPLELDDIKFSLEVTDSKKFATPKVFQLRTESSGLTNLQTTYEELLTQTSYDLLSYISARISFHN